MGDNFDGYAPESGEQFNPFADQTPPVEGGTDVATIPDEPQEPQEPAVETDGQEPGEPTEPQEPNGSDASNQLVEAQKQNELLRQQLQVTQNIINNVMAQREGQQGPRQGQQVPSLPDIPDGEMVLGSDVKALMQSQREEYMGALEKMYEAVESRFRPMDEKTVKSSHPDYEDVLKHTVDLYIEDPSIKDLIQMAPNRAEMAYRLGKTSPAYIESQIQKGIKEALKKMNQTEPGSGSILDANRREDQKNQSAGDPFSTMSDNAFNQYQEDVLQGTIKPMSHYLQIK